MQPHAAPRLWFRTAHRTYERFLAALAARAAMYALPQESGGEPGPVLGERGGFLAMLSSALTIAHPLRRRKLLPGRSPSDPPHELGGAATVVRCLCPACQNEHPLESAALLETLDASGRLDRNGIPELVRQLVLLRDLFRCQVPGCSAPAEQLHHIDAQRDGKNHRPSNLIGVCIRHHQCLELFASHPSKIRVGGQAPDGLEWTLPGERTLPSRRDRFWPRGSRRSPEPAASLLALPMGVLELAEETDGLLWWLCLDEELGDLFHRAELEVRLAYGDGLSRGQVLEKLLDIAECEEWPAGARAPATFDPDEPPGHESPSLSLARALDRWSSDRRHGPPAGAASLFECGRCGDAWQVRPGGGLLLPPAVRVTQFKMQAGEPGKPWVRLLPARLDPCPGAREELQPPARSELAALARDRGCRVPDCAHGPQGRPAPLRAYALPLLVRVTAADASGAWPAHDLVTLCPAHLRAIFDGGLVLEATGDGDARRLQWRAVTPHSHDGALPRAPARRPTPGRQAHLLARQRGRTGPRDRQLGPGRSRRVGRGRQSSPGAAPDSGQSGI